MSQSSPLEIVIAGGGTAGWVAAATFARFLGNAASITLVESDEIGTVGVGEATIPQIHNLIIGLGLDQADFVRRTTATFKLGIEFDGWLGGRSNFMHSFGTTGRGVGLIPFRQLWLRGRALGVAGEFGEYAFNIAAARRGRMATGTGSSGTIPELAYAYHFDASLFARMLREYAEERGVTRVEGKIVQVERDPQTGDIAALALHGERRVAGTFFIDCTGFRSLLLGQALGVPYVDWSNWLPCDSALAVGCESSAAFRPYTQAMARPAGWQWRIPLQERTGNGHVYCSALMSQDEATALLLASLDGPPVGDPRPIRFTSGRRASFWSHNCLALGLAAGFMEPLESTSIHLVQSAVARLLNLLPGTAPMDAARDTFNRLSDSEWARVRDFIALHYFANAREGEPFWDQCRHAQLPETLAEKIRLFREAGLFVREEEELFLDDSWGQVMIGQGIMPESWSPLADNVPGEDIGPFLDTLANSYRVKAETLPTHRQFVAAMTGNRIKERQ